MYPLLLDCFRSGQISARQWQAHLTDDDFRAWLQRHAPEVL